MLIRSILQKIPVFWRKLVWGDLEMNETQIESVLQQIIALLKKHQVHQWTDVLENLERTFSEACLSGDKKAKLYALEEMGQLYGGMGSFNDLQITHIGGHNIAPQEEITVNETLNSLRNQLGQLLENVGESDN
jgi:hypothetical protein